MPPSKAASPRREPEHKKVYILYDGRARYQDTDDCTVMCIAESVAEAESLSRDGFEGVDAIWYEYDLVGDIAQNENERPDIGNGVLA